MAIYLSTQTSPSAYQRGEILNHNPTKEFDIGIDHQEKFGDWCLSLAHPAVHADDDIHGHHHHLRYGTRGRRGLAWQKKPFRGRRQPNECVLRSATSLAQAIKIQTCLPQQSAPPPARTAQQTQTQTRAEQTRAAGQSSSLQSNMRRSLAADPAAAAASSPDAKKAPRRSTVRRARNKQRFRGTAQWYVYRWAPTALLRQSRVRSLRSFVPSGPRFVTTTDLWQPRGKAVARSPFPYRRLNFRRPSRMSWRALIRARFEMILASRGSRATWSAGPFALSATDGRQEVAPNGTRQFVCP